LKFPISDLEFGIADLPYLVECSEFRAESLELRV